MRADARRALLTIRECLASDRFSITMHFAQRMVQRGLWRWEMGKSVPDAQTLGRIEKLREESARDGVVNLTDQCPSDASATRS